MTYAEIRERAEKWFELGRTTCKQSIENTTEFMLEVIRTAYKNGEINQKEMLNAVECTIAIKIREEIKEHVRNI